MNRNKQNCLKRASRFTFLLQLLPKSWAQRLFAQRLFERGEINWSLKPSMPVVLLFCYNSFRNRGPNDCFNVEKSTSIGYTGAIFKLFNLVFEPQSRSKVLARTKVIKHLYFLLSVKWPALTIYLQPSSAAINCTLKTKFYCCFQLFFRNIDRGNNQYPSKPGEV